MRFSFALATAALLTCGTLAHADTYKIYGINAGSEPSNIGFTNNGNSAVTAAGSINCAPGVFGCFVITTATATGVTSITVPTQPTLDNGNGPNDFQLSYAGSPNNPLKITDLGDGETSVLGQSYAIGNIRLNSYGDVAFIEEDAGPTGQDEDFLAYNVTSHSITPEPSSLTLLSTGLLGVCGVIRKRFV